MRSCLTYWLESLTLLHFGFNLIVDVLHFGIPLSFTVLHSGKSILPHCPKGLGFVVIAQLLAVVRFLLSSHTSRYSFVIGKYGLND